MWFFSSFPSDFTWFFSFFNLFSSTDTNDAIKMSPPSPRADLGKGSGHKSLLFCVTSSPLPRLRMNKEPCWGAPTAGADGAAGSLVQNVFVSGYSGSKACRAAGSQRLHVWSLTHPSWKSEAFLACLSIVSPVSVLWVEKGKSWERAKTTEKQTERVVHTPSKFYLPFTNTFYRPFPNGSVR